MSSVFKIHAPQFSTLRCKCSRIAAWRTMNMDSEFSPPMNMKKKKKEVSLQLSSPKPPVSTLRFCDLHFDRSQPSEPELGPHSKFEFGQFVARKAQLDEEYWTAAWLRAETEWENRISATNSNSKFVLSWCSDRYKRLFAEQEYNAIKKRCNEQNGDSSQCIIAVRKDRKYVKRTILKSIVGTLDLRIRNLLQRETFPRERLEDPPFCSISRTPSNRYGYIANLSVARSFRGKGIAKNMLYFAIESAGSIGVERVYVHVHRNNGNAQKLYYDLGFKIVEKAHPLLKKNRTYLLRLQM